MAKRKQHGRGSVIQRRPAETLTGTAALAAFVGLFVADETTAAALAGAVGLIPAVMSFVVDRFGNPFGGEVGAPPSRDYAPALDTMYSHLSSAVGGVLKAATDSRQPKRSLATIDRVAGIIGRLDPRIAQGDAVTADWLPEDEESAIDQFGPEAEGELRLPEEEGGVEPEGRAPRRPRRLGAAT